MLDITARVYLRGGQIGFEDTAIRHLSSYGALLVAYTFALIARPPVAARCCRRDYRGSEAAVRTGVVVCLHATASPAIWPL